VSSPDFRTFVDSLIGDHQSWLSSHPSPSGTDFFDHYVGDETHPTGLLRRYEAWRSEHGYTRVRPWNGTEALDRPATTDIPSPGRVFPWLSGTSARPPFGDGFLASTSTTADLQGHFASVNALGQAIRAHWLDVRAFNPGGDIGDDDTAPYSIRFWGFMKWAAVMRNRFLGIPVFPMPIVYDADGVPLSDIEYMDTANHWHRIWHLGTSCGANTQGLNSPFGQFCGRMTPAGEEFLRFHRDATDTYDNWRRRNGMPIVASWKPPGVHFDHGGPDVSDVPATQEAEIAEYGKRFNTLDGMANHQEGALHGSGHTSTAGQEIADLDTNNYSPRFFAWHGWMDYLWEKRQPRFNSFRPVASDGTDYQSVLTVVRPAAGPDQIQPNNALTGVDAAGRGSLWLEYNVRTETYGRDVNLTLTAEVFRNSSDVMPVASLAATAVAVSPVAQGVDSGAVQIQFTGLDADGEGAFARQTLPGGAAGFKNGRIRLTGHLVPVGNVPGSTATDAPNDQFDHDQHIDVVLVQETRPPLVTTLLNRSAFSVDEVVINAAGGAQSVFTNAFFVVLQDPPEPPPAFGASGILPQYADPAHTTVSGIFADGSVIPAVEVVDEAGNHVNWFSVAFTDVFEEQPSLHDNASQRVLFRYLAIVDVAAVSALLPAPGATPRFARLRISARDRSGNVVEDVYSAQIKLFRDANPYMVDVRDENPHWLSIDTRVFTARQTETKFGHSVAASGGPSQYITDVIDEFNAGTQNFEGIPADQGQAPLELAPQVSGTSVYNFALARVRVRTQVVVPDVRVFFRLFTTALSNLSFNPTGYPTSAGTTPIALLGRTSPDAEIVSIPFFAAARVETRAGLAAALTMEAQTDPPNAQQFDITPPGAETIRYFGAYLDINSNTERYPQAPTGNGPFPSSECVSIRNILRGQHQCMVAEIFYAGDPTDANTNPGTSDNLAQRNLLIVETDNPGNGATHTVQHSFDIVLPTRRERIDIDEQLRLQEHADNILIAKAAREDLGVADATHEREGSEKLRLAPTLGTPFHRGTALELRRQAATVAAQQGKPPSWRHTGFDELLIFWNNLPPESEVEVYLPGLDVDYVTLLRTLRHAPRTVRSVDDHTLRLIPEGVTHLPIPDLGAKRLAGLLTVRLPDAIKTGQVFTVDVLQVRSPAGLVVGAFQLMIPVIKARAIWGREVRVLDVFEERLGLTPASNRWHPILERQVAYLRGRVRDLTAEAANECAERPGDGEQAWVRVRVILDRIRVLDPFGPLVHGSGQVSLIARVTSEDAGGIGATTALPATGAYPMPGPHGDTIRVGRELFRGTVVDDLTVEIFSSEPEEHERTCHYRRQFKGDPHDWLGEYKPSDQARDPENVGDWQLWYRIEEL
jgi:hypothetical protein